MRHSRFSFSLLFYVGVLQLSQTLKLTEKETIRDYPYIYTCLRYSAKTALDIEW